MLDDSTVSMTVQRNPEQAVLRARYRPAWRTVRWAIRVIRPGISIVAVIISAGVRM
jgi:hypothetical protein